MAQEAGDVTALGFMRWNPGRGCNATNARPGEGRTATGAVAQGVEAPVAGRR